jgi:hypothetical protein
MFGFLRSHSEHVDGAADSSASPRLAYLSTSSAIWKQEKTPGQSLKRANHPGFLGADLGEANEKTLRSDRVD